MPVKKGWGGAPAIRLTIGLMLAAFFSFMALFALFIYFAVQQNQGRLEEHTAATTQVVQTNAFWISEVANQTLRRVDAALGPFMAGSDASIASVLDGLPNAAETYVIDANANTIFSTVPGTENHSAADREYFTALKDGALFYTSPLLTSRITGDRIFVFSKRVTRNGAFAGAIMISFSESLLKDLLATLDLPEGSTLSLVRDDGLLMARSPSSGEDVVDLSQTVLFTTHLPQADFGTYGSQASPVDGIARMVGYRRVPNTRIIAVASMASEPSWTALRNAVLTVVLIVSPVLIGLFIGSWWIVRLLRDGEQRNRQLQESVDLNTMLFREIHHRVKNNLASIQALVRMQDIPKGAKRDLESRFAAMAAMHEHIYKHDRYEDINAADFIPAVMSKVIEAYGADVTIVYELDNVAVDRDHATPLALLLNELATNSCKYAFSHDQIAEISVSLRFAPGGKARLVFRDNGIGLPEALPTTSMGMRIVRGAVAQMGGTAEFKTDNGTVFTGDLTLTPDGRAASPSAHDPAFSF